jgi:hypothetical protein
MAGDKNSKIILLNLLIELNEENEVHELILLLITSWSANAYVSDFGGAITKKPFR